jgi:phage repressor protein C with HTH and peptisase S24 domain
MDNFRDYLDLLCRTRGVLYAELARRIGVTKGYIGQLVHGHSKPPPRTRVLQLAEALGLAPAERERLLDLALRERARPEIRSKIEELDAQLAALRETRPEESNVAEALSVPTPDLRAAPPIPVIGYVAAGETNIAFTDAGLPAGATLPGEEPIARWPGVGPRAYALRITGESMLPLCPPGTTIVVDPDRTPRSGEPAICQVTDGRSYFKILHHEPGGGVRLVSTNAAAAPDIVLRRPDVRRLHKVIATLYP